MWYPGKFLYQFIKARCTQRSTAGGSAEDATVTGRPAQQSSNRATIIWRVTLLAALAIPVFLETLDYTVVATAQSHIASVFNRLDLQSWIGTTYLLTSTVFLPIFASITDLYGRHLALQISLVFFLVGSAISTGAQSMPTMLAGRGVAGIGAAGILTAVRVILADSRSLDDNNWQISMLWLLYAVAYTVGPVIGGALTSVSFRWIFAINLPCCVAAMVICFVFLRDKTKGAENVIRGPHGDELSEPSMIEKLLYLDWIGAALFIVGSILVLLALNWGSEDDWAAAKVIASFVVGGFLILLCLVWEYILQCEQRSSHPRGYRVLWAMPMLPLEVFRSYDVCAVQAGFFVAGMVMLVMFYFVAIFMTIVNGYSPTKAGAQLVYFAPGMGGGSWISIILVKNLRQPKYPIILGSVVTAVALGLISMGINDGNKSSVNGFLAMAGAGIGLSIGPLSTHVRFSQPDNRVAIVTALSLFFRSLGGTVGLAQCAAVLNGKVKAYITSLVRAGEISASDASSLSLTASGSNLASVDGIAALPEQLQTFVRNAFRDGTRWSFISLIPWAGVAVILVLFLSHIPDTDREMQEKQAAASSSDLTPESMEKPLQSSVSDAPRSQIQNDRVRDDMSRV